MHAFGQRLRQPVRERLEHDAAVVIVRRLESRHVFIDAESCGHREGPDVVGAAALRRRDEIRQADCA